MTERVLSRCRDVPTRTVSSAKPTDVIKASEILTSADDGIIGKYLAGKGVLFVGPPGKAVDVFTMPDERMVCPHFDKLVLASNGCPYRCDWCYLKLTYRAAFPFMKVCTDLDTIKNQLKRRLSKDSGPVMFNSGEMADSLALEHLTGHMKEMIPWFAETENGHLFLLTKSDNVDDILDLDHLGRTVVTWSMNAPSVSRRFELGAPTFERRLRAAESIQAAGYPVRVRLDPIVPVEGWRDEYAETIRRIFEALTPERITIGTLRFEPNFFRMRWRLLTTGEATWCHDLPSVRDVLVLFDLSKGLFKGLCVTDEFCPRIPMMVKARARGHGQNARLVPLTFHRQFSKSKPQPSRSRRCVVAGVFFRVTVVVIKIGRSRSDLLLLLGIIDLRIGHKFPLLPVPIESGQTTHQLSLEDRESGFRVIVKLYFVRVALSPFGLLQADVIEETAPTNEGPAEMGGTSDFSRHLFHGGGEILR